MAGVASYFCILYTLNLALYLLKALAFPNPGSIKPDTLTLHLACRTSATLEYFCRVIVSRPESGNYLSYLFTLPGLFLFNSIE